MNITALIQDTLKDLEENRFELDTVVQRCIRVAYSLNDFENVYWFKLQLIDLRDKQKLEKIKKEFVSSMEGIGKSRGMIQEKLKFYTESYYETRTTQIYNIESSKLEDKIDITSLSDILSKLRLNKVQLERNKVPDGLHTLDAYYETQKKQKLDALLYSSHRALDTIVEKIKSQVYSYLIELEHRTKQQEDMGKVEPVNNKHVFIIHGHNEAKWRELEKLLKDEFNLNPIVLKECPDKGSQTIIDKFEFYAEKCSYAFAIFTPDDIVINDDGSKYFQARPNVIFELGWFSSYLGRRRVCILFQEGKGMDIFSDFQGVMQKRFYNNISEIYREIKLELQDVGMI